MVASPKARALCAVAAVSVLTLGCSSGGASPSSPAPRTAEATPVSTSTTLPPTPGAPACGTGDALLASMTTRDKLAQLLMVGVTGADDAKAVVDQHHVGGIFIGSWTDRSMLTDGTVPALADTAPLPPTVSVDEEGGRVSRLANLIGSQPSPRVLAQTSTPDEVRGIAFQRGQAMRNLGINVDFAPVVDVTEESDDEVIGDRSFGSDPAKVIEYAGAYAQGLRDAGITPVLKHFPGHGHSSGDSHVGGVVTPPLDALKANDLVPYGALTTAQPVAVMVGHMQVPGLTGDLPASLSPAAYGLLRSGGYGGPGFGGLVYTDDLSSMGAINQRYGVADAVLKALQAGADVALWVTTTEVPAVLDRLESAVNGGELNMGAVDASVLKVAGTKGPSPRCGG
ncbi:glycoside hydrolase family 3 N-terminal domain-containing protein [Mycolicibacterium grossiae]|uniref:beta-N-acetylhexosaminidase n=1 Tax=Mycolicibacterium grossiae TaxID=1552759 RepID=A0A1E8Q5K2_9MYCO|nr:glycoside hydrolase family 3 N-terminal domain-containing protein [Mycolicibacterium grossiae]OFJ53154.1 beta-glucosidase [Mycolicibacterium grossiae]QEM44734.1 glycoside hydrolase family 3 protein [Mycolicibacterium grossiae]